MPKNKFTYNQNIVATCLPLVPYTLYFIAFFNLAGLSSSSFNPLFFPLPSPPYMYTLSLKAGFH